MLRIQRKSSVRRASAALLSGILCASGLLAQEGPTARSQTDVFSRYVWRGTVANADPVLQTTTTAGYRGFHLSLMTNTDLTRAHSRRGGISNLDFDAGYDHALERITFSGGAIRYTLPGTDVPPAAEVYAGAALALPLHPSARAYFGVQSARGVYATFDVAQAFALPRPRRDIAWSGELTTGVGVGSSSYNHCNFGIRQPAILDFHPGLSTTLAVGRRLRLIPRAGYSTVLDRRLRRSPVARPLQLFFGLTLLLVFD
jgi:hypothetical protein